MRLNSPLLWPAVFAIVLIANLVHGQSMVDPSMYQAPKSDTYTLDHGDTLGVFVEGVVGDFGSMPPVHQPPEGSNIGPAMGYPTLVLHDGTIRLPLVDPISVRGITVSQVESLLKKTYREGADPIITDRSRVIVSLIRKRTVNVMVIRGDQSQARSTPGLAQRMRGPVSARSDNSAQIYSLNMPAGESDVLGALMQSGGLPGVNASDQMRIIRSAQQNRHPVDQSFGAQTPFPRSGTVAGYAVHGTSESVPIRDYGEASTFPRSHSRLDNGDIVSVEAKPTEVFYTGGQLGGGEYVIPRDRPMSLMDAVSQAGGIPQERRGLAAIPLQEPRLLKLVRNVGGQQVAYQFDLSGGYSQQAAQVRVRSGDYLILDYSPAQRVQNVGIGVLNTYGVRQLFRN